MRRARVYTTGSGPADYWIVEYIGPVCPPWTAHDTWELALDAAVRWVDFR